MNGRSMRAFKLVSAAAFLAGSLALAAAGKDAESKAQSKPIQFDAAEINWKDGPPTLPLGTKTAVLEGDPKQEGLFTMRLKLPAGTKIAPHWHPREERVTVLAGSLSVGFGEKPDRPGRRFRAGAYYVNPPRVSHYVWTEEEALVQITGSGPWELHYLGGGER